MRTSTLEREEVVAVAAPATSSQFDPLVKLHGLWTTELAERYLPIDGMPPAKYECLDGDLIMSPREGAANSYAAGRLVILLDAPAQAAGHEVYTAVNMRFNDGTWIEPDVTVLRELVDHEAIWVPADEVLMPIELVSRSSVRRDRVDKPALCAAAKVPFFMRVEISAGERDIEIELLRLNRNRRYVTQAKARAGQRLQTELPFSFDFDPVTLFGSRPVTRGAK